jgi:hypothetical protein
MARWDSVERTPKTAPQETVFRRLFTGAGTLLGRSPSGRLGIDHEAMERLERIYTMDANQVSLPRVISNRLLAIPIIFMGTVSVPWFAYNYQIHCRGCRQVASAFTAD